MPRKTYPELIRELNSKTKSVENLKAQVSKHKLEALRYKTIARNLPVQYERVIKEYKKTLEDVLGASAWKLLFIKMNQRYNKLRGRD